MLRASDALLRRLRRRLFETPIVGYSLAKPREPDKLGLLDVTSGRYVTSGRFSQEPATIQKCPRGHCLLILAEPTPDRCSPKPATPSHCVISEPSVLAPK